MSPVFFPRGSCYEFLVYAFKSSLHVFLVIEVQLIYNVVLVSGVQQSDSVMCMYVCVLSCFSCVQLFVTLWTAACQALLSVGFSRQEYCSGQPFPSPGDLPDLGIVHGSPALKADSLLSEPQGSPHIECVSSNPHAQFIPPPPFPFGNHRLFSMSYAFSLTFCKSVYSMLCLVFCTLFSSLSNETHRVLYTETQRTASSFSMAIEHCILPQSIDLDFFTKYSYITVLCICL